jgi:cell wall-associated NlpC family hydrolase
MLALIVDSRWSRAEGVVAEQSKNSDISADEGAKITAEARTWKDTPYKLVGAGSIKGSGGDCSGSSWRIYTAAGLPYEYRSTSTFIDYVNKTKRFRELRGNEAMQEGDLLFWPDHMAIYFTSQTKRTQLRIALTRKGSIGLR